MNKIHIGILVLFLTVCGIAQIRSADAARSSAADREELIGAWHLASIVGPDGKPVTSGVPVGMLIYTPHGHMSVQLMYPASEESLCNEYVQNGYEASFGSFDVNEATHTLTHHVKGSNTGDPLVGKDLPRIYQLTGHGQLVIKSARTDEHWSVTWEHY